MKHLNSALTITFFQSVSLIFTGCQNKMNHQTQINKELSVIDSLLRSEEYAYEMAATLDASYFVGIGQVAPPFLSAEEDTATIAKSIKEEKIATNIAGFYALECGIGLLCDQQDLTPVEMLNKIVNKETSAADNLILNRFANATWKAGQPFRSLDRIQRPIFMIFSLLPPDEVEKDHNQVITAATRLLASMQDVSNKNKDEQMQKLRSLLQDKNYALEMAEFLAGSYYTSQQQQAPPFLSAEEDTATTKKSVKEQKIATNLAGFYALECGLNYFVSTQDKLPSDILKSLVNNTIIKEDALIFARFANATWKAGQPFRSMDRITRDTFTPFYFLNNADIDKDIVQVKAAAKKLLESM